MADDNGTNGCDTYWALDGVPDGGWTLDDAFVDSAAKELDQLASYITDRLVPHFKDIYDRMGTEDTSPFGGKDKVKNAPAMWNMHNSFLTTARTSYEAIAKELTAAAAASRTIAANYRKAEERNAANVKDIEKAFSDGASPPSNPSGTQTSSDSSTNGEF